MVDLTERLQKIKRMVDSGKYFTINRARQYGKTTTLKALEKYLKDEYIVISLDFQRIDSDAFSSVGKFSQTFARLLLDANEFQGMEIPQEFLEAFRRLNDRVSSNVNMDDLFRIIMRWCREAEKPIVLMIDEVDSAADNQVFLDFLAQLRSSYIERNTLPAFWSVILAGVTDIKNLRRKLRHGDTHKFNSPWNIAADFNVEMSFTIRDIEGMLREYEADFHTGMDMGKIARTVYDYTGGYPFLVSRICQLIDEDLHSQDRFESPQKAWTEDGVREAVRKILMEKNTLFESLMGKVHDNSELKNILRRILFAGEVIPYNPDNMAVSDAQMYGFIRNDNGFIKIANRIFETRLYNFFLNTEELQNTEIYKIASREKEQFIRDGKLNMEQILNRFVISFDDLYGDQGDRFDEEEGRRRFLLFVRPIINGTGNYYIEARTRNNERMDVVIDYLGERYIVELKIWRGNAYNERGEKQISEYLEYYHLKKGYMLSYNFNKNKQVGVHHIQIDGKELIEAIV